MNVPNGNRVAVVGSGAAGTLTAVQLLRRSYDPRFEVVLVERGERFSRGIAYGTTSRRHLLNVPAGKMSAFPDRPNHLVDWLRRGPMPEAGPYSFAPRMLFGRYIEETLREAERSSPARLKRLRGEVVGLDADGSGATVRLFGGGSMRAGSVVLATGNLPAASPRVETPEFYESARYVPDAWGGCALTDIPSDEPVLLIGTSLTAIDVTLSLRERGHRDVVHAVSRRGLVPNPHAPAAPEPHRDFLPPEGTPFGLTDLFETLRREAKRAEVEGGCWQAVIDALRLRTSALWAAATDEERRCFLRHVQPYWEVHRHRIAPEVGEEISHLRETGSFVPRAGRIRTFTEHPDGVTVDLSLRGGGTEKLEVSRVINCTGPHTDVRRVAHTLLRSMLEAGYVRPGTLDIGLDTDENGALISRDGQPSRVLYTLGTHRKGSLWETIAIPEIREQAAVIAGAILSEASVERCRSRLVG